jgi:hypothetical protein
MRIRSVLTHSFQAVLEGALIALIVVGVVAGTVFAARGGHSTGGAGSYSVSVTPDGPYTFGESVYVSTNAPIYPSNTGPWIWLRCYQGSTLVLSGDHAAFPSGWYYNWPFKLGPTQSWSGGDAECTVRVAHTQRNKVVIDASTSFHVDG